MMSTTIKLFRLNPGQIFDQFFGQVFDQGFLPPKKYTVQYYWDGEIQCTVLPGLNITVLQYYRDGAKREKNHVLKIPYYQ